METKSLQNKIKNLANASVRQKELEEEVASLKRDVSRLNAELSKLEFVRNNQSAIETVKQQIEVLQTRSSTQELNFEEVKKLDVLIKNVLILQGLDKNKRDNSATKLSEEELLSQLKNSQ